MIKKLLLFLLLVSYLYSQEKVIIQLKWLHQFQFAGYYAAKEKGFYQQVGLDVEIRQRDVKYNNIEQVMNGEAHYGVADSVLLQYKAKGEPIVIVSPIFQHSPSVLISLKSKAINSPYNLDDKNILFYTNNTDGFSILSMIKKLNANPNLVRERQKNDYMKLINGEVDLLAGYLSNEPFYLQEKGIEVNTIYPANYGFDLYGDMLFTTLHEAKNYPNRVKRFKEATLKGWEYALNNKEEIIQLIHKKYNQNKSLDHLRYEANAIESLISRDLVSLGAIDEGRLKYISDLYTEYGLSSSSFDVKDFVFQEDKVGLNLTNKERDFLSENRVFKVSNELDWAPFDFANNGVPKGFSIDLLNLLANKLGIKLKYINGYTWNDLVELFKNKELDILHSLAVNDERKKIGLFSEPYIRYQTHFVTRDLNPEINSINDITDKVIVVGKGWAIETFLKKNYPDIKLISVSSTDEILNTVSSGKAYAAILNKNVASYFIQKNSMINLKVSNWCKEFDGNKARMLHFLAQKNSPELISALNKALDALTLGELETLNKKWFGSKKEDVNALSIKEKIFLENHPTIRFRVLPNRPPFEFEKDGKPVGIAVDYVKQSAKNIGLNVKFILEDSSVKKAYETIKTTRDKYDTILFTVKNKKRAEEFSFGTSYLSYPMMIITQKNGAYIASMKGLENKTIALEKGFLTNKWISRDYPSIKIINAKNTNEALKMLNNGDVDAYVGNAAVANYMSVFGGMNNLKIAAPSGYSDVKFSFVGPKEWPELTTILSKGYNKISPSEHIAIQQKWFSLQTIEKIDYELIWKIIIGVILLIVWFIWWNRTIIEEKNKTKQALHELELSQQEQLKQQQIILDQSKVAALGEMIGNIAHQWRQPLSAISASASGMKIQKQLDLLDDKCFEDSIGSIMKNSQYLSETIDTFRSYIKDEKKYEKVIIQDVLHKSVDLLIDSLNSSNIKLEEHFSVVESIEYEIPSGELTQVLINIINNAKDILIERNIKKPLVIIALRKDENSIYITIEDNAGGISEDILPKIFDPYFTTKHQSQGTGLGLHMSYRIVTESLHGELTTHNTENGAKFCIELPL